MFIIEIGRFKFYTKDYKSIIYWIVSFIGRHFRYKMTGRGERYWSFLSLLDKVDDPIYFGNECLYEFPFLYRMFNKLKILEYKVSIDVLIRSAFWAHSTKRKSKLLSKLIKEVYYLVYKFGLIEAFITSAKLSFKSEFPIKFISTDMIVY